MTDVVALAAELLAISSLSSTEGAVVDFVSRWLIFKAAGQGRRRAKGSQPGLAPVYDIHARCPSFRRALRFRL